MATIKYIFGLIGLLGKESPTAHRCGLELGFPIQWRLYGKGKLEIDVMSESGR